MLAKRSYVMKKWKTSDGCEILDHKGGMYMLAEWKRILWNRRVLVGGVLLLIVNLLLFCYLCPDGTVSEVRKQTSQRMELLNGYRCGNVTQQDVQQELAQLEVIIQLFHFRTTKQLCPQEYVLLYQAEENSLRNEYPPIAHTFDQGGYDENAIRARYCLLSDFLEDLSYHEEYQKRLEQLHSNAQTMGHVAVFAGNTNIQKTAADYTGMEHTPITPGNDISTLKLLSYGVPSLICLVFSLVLVTTAIEERRCGLLPLLHSCKNGRETLTLWRFGGLIAGSVLFSALLYGTTMLAALWVFGSIQPGRTVQSLPELFGITMPMSLGQLWGRYLVLGMMVQLMLTALVWGVFALSEHRVLAVFWLAVILGGSLLLYRLLPEQSSVAFLKYANPIAAMNVMRLIGTYRNVPLGTWLVEKSWLVFGTLAAVPCICVPLAFWNGACRYSVADHGRGYRLVLKFTHGSRSLYHRAVSLLPFPILELYKTLVLRRGVVVLLALLILLAGAYRPKTPVYVGDAQVMHDFYEQFGGMGITQEVLFYTEELQTELTEVEEQWQRASDAYDSGSISMEEYELAYRIYEAYGLRRQALEQMQSRLEYIRQQESLGYDAVLVEPTAYEHLLDSSNTDRVMESIAMFALVLLCVAACSEDAKRGLPVLLRSTPKGRGWLAWHRVGVGLLFSVAICTLLKGARVYSMAVAYGLPQLWAPVHSLEAFAESPLKVSIAGALAVQFLKEWLVYAGGAMVTAAVCLIRKRRSA